MLLIVVDSHSKWMEAVPLKTSTAGTTVNALRTLFSTFGLPRTIVTDNGSQFSSQEFQTFAALNGIKHMRAAPYQPQSNGLAERAVRTIKQSLQKTSKVQCKRGWPGSFTTTVERPSRVAERLLCC